MAGMYHIDAYDEGSEGRLYTAHAGLELVPLSKSMRHPRGGEMRLVKASGFASVESYDPQGHRVIQDGIDWDPFMGVGRKAPGPVTYEHTDKANLGLSNLVGFPVRKEQRLTDTGVKGTWVETMLMTELPWTQEILKKSAVFRDTQSPLQFGFSVEGAYPQAAMKRTPAGYDILRSRVVSLAVTLVPQNNDTWLELAASRRLRKSAVGYPTQGEAYVSQPGVEVDPLIPQSLAGGSASSGLVPFDTLVKAFISTFPELSVDQGKRFVEQLLSILGSSVPA